MKTTIDIKAVIDSLPESIRSQFKNDTITLKGRVPKAEISIYLGHELTKVIAKSGLLTGRLNFILTPAGFDDDDGAYLWTAYPC